MYHRIQKLFKVILYGRKWLELFMQDSVLDLFHEKKRISKNILFRQNAPEGWERVVIFLINDNLLSDNGYDVEITQKGILKYKEGGYRKEELHRRLNILAIILGVIVSIVSIYAIF